MAKRKENSGGNQREKIVAVASSLMSKKGYVGASLQEIADQVGIHKSTIFHYFKNKEEILLAVLRLSIQEVTKNLNLILEDESLSPEEKLKAAIFNHLQLLVKYKDNVNVYNSDIRFLSERNRRKYLETRKYYGACFEQIIDEVKKSKKGYFKGLDTKLVSYAILGMCNWVGRWYKESGSTRVEEIGETFCKLIMPELDRR